jgi:hypothetical protein
MQAHEFKLPEHLDRKAEKGKILFKGERMVMMSADSYASFLRQIIDLGGVNMAKILIRRFGEEDGKRQMRVAREKKIMDTDWDAFVFAPISAGWEGLVAAQVTEFELSKDEPQKCKIKGTWKNSFIPKKFVEFFGKSRDPICWVLAGYASGSGTEWFENKRRVVCKEISCIAQGNEFCEFDIRFEEDWISD